LSLQRYENKADLKMSVLKILSEKGDSGRENPAFSHETDNRRQKKIAWILDL